MSPYTPHEFYRALKGIITNLPEYVVSIQIELRARQMPLMHLTTELEKDGKPVVEDGSTVKQRRTFVIVPVDALDHDWWASIEKARISERARQMREELGV
jgi:hypothetical protein